MIESEIARGIFISRPRLNVTVFHWLIDHYIRGIAPKYNSAYQKSNDSPIHHEIRRYNPPSNWRLRQRCTEQISELHRP